MPTLDQDPLQGDVLKYEMNGNYSREAVTLLTGAAYKIGAVLGKITASGKYRLSPNAEVGGAEGAETAVAVLLYDVDATGGDATGVILARGPAIVSEDALVHDASVDDGTKIAAKKAQLAAAGIIARATA